MIKEVVSKRIGVKSEPSSVEENATEGNENTSEPKRTITEAGNTNLSLFIALVNFEIVLQEKMKV